MQWYYSKNGTQLGPVDESSLRSKIASGEVSPTDLVWRDGMTDWLPSGRVPEFSAPSPEFQNPAATGEITGGSANTPYSPPRSPVGGYTGGPEIQNYLWQSIVVTILCCWPFGIPAIVYAAKVDGLKAQGNYQGAADASANAKKWCMISLGAWLVVIVIYVILIAGGIVTGSLQN